MNTMPLQDCTPNTHAPRYSCHQDINGFEIELRQGDKRVDIEEISGLVYTLFDVYKLRPYLNAFREDERNSVRISAVGEDKPALLSAVQGVNGIEGDYPAFSVMYFREDKHGEAVTPLNMPKTYADFDALMEG